jgi:hypothetical protein
MGYNQKNAAECLKFIRNLTQTKPLKTIRQVNNENTFLKRVNLYFSTLVGRQHGEKGQFQKIAP